MKILVTGSNGFIGKNIVNYLVENTEHIIICTYHNNNNNNNNNNKNKNKNKKIKYAYFDLNNIPSINFKSCGYPDMLIHCAWEGYRDIYSLNHITVNFFNSYLWIEKLISEGLKNVVCIGSAFECGLINGELNENINTKPNTSYSVAKDSLRKSLELLTKDSNVTFKWLRVFNVFGKDQHPKTLFGLLDTAILEKKTTFKMSGGEQLRDYIDIEDLAIMITRVSLQNKINGVINCCSGTPVSIRKLVEQYLVQRNVEMELDLGFYPYPEYEPMAYWGSVEKLNTVITSVYD